MHHLLEKADKGVFYFPGPDELEAPPLDEFSSGQERLVKLAYFNYWLAALRVYYINAAWSFCYHRIEVEGTKVLGRTYAEACLQIDHDYYEAMTGLFEHHGYDYQGPPTRRMV